MLTKESTKIALTGGHFGPAYELVVSLQPLGKQIVFFGRKNNFSNQSSTSLEWKIFSQYTNLKFVELNSPRFQNQNWLKIILSLPQLFSSFFKARQILRQEQVEEVFTFGGYLSVPVILAAKSLGIPIYFHEQTLVPGSANRFLSRFATKIWVAFPEAKKYFPKKKTTVLGNPMLNRLQKKSLPQWFADSHKPLLLILGGSSGAHSLNCLIEKILPELKTQFQIVHQIGESKYQDYERLSKMANANYFPRISLIPEEINWLYQQSALIVTRSGANTFFELIYFQKPAVLIPLPWSANNEQLAQAKLLETKKIALVYKQSQNSPEQLLTKIITVYKFRDQYQKNFFQLKDYAKLIISGSTLYQTCQA